ncbi:uncharacterized protein LOC129747010 [Uranotaenia lowii]|uniref:uncharacterized protein LOC129747010 n=1 Tax=Uranotaenia lowii TaxID=190385 RepID=UPI00247AC6F8|nr:uncharacterized protein LOC129747010 [Uranotaenia lowii]
MAGRGQKGYVRNRNESLTSDKQKFEAKYNAAIGAYKNYLQEFQLMLVTKERRMNDVLARREIPLWFQELSDQQVEAMDKLLEAVRDDSDEGTVFRCQALLKVLGVVPLCPVLVIREALILAKENDLSFLWFLLELYYSKVERQGIDHSYTNNERLIMSAICHLDIMTTLRGLEKILPPKKERCCSKRTKPKCIVQYCSPYLEPQGVRKPLLNSAFDFRPEAPLCIGRYASYRDQHFVIPNEASRWFAKLSRSNQTEKPVEAQPKKPEEMTPATCDSAELIVRELLNDQICHMVDHEVDRENLCRKHRDMQKRRNKLLSLVNKRSVVREKLDNEVLSVEEQMKRCEKECREKRMIQLMLKHLINDSIVACMLTPRSKCPECWEAYEHQRRLQSGATCSCAKEPGIFCLRNMMKKGGPIEKYFTCCKGTVPFEFDYRKILDYEPQRPQCPVKEAIRVALGVQEEEHDESKAISRCMNEMWRCEIKLWNERFLQGQKEVESKQAPKDLLDYKCIESTDPEFLRMLLKRGLLKLTEDTKYVLATFPEAHKLPFLNAWIQDRYGAKMSSEEKNELLQESKHFWDWLIPRATKMRWPVCRDLRMFGRVNWNYKDRLQSDAIEHLTKFYHKFKNIQIQEARLYWNTMDPYHTNVDRFRQIFNDYQPNCETRIEPMIRPWHKFEFHPNPPMLKASDSKILG